MPESTRTKVTTTETGSLANELKKPKSQAYLDQLMDLSNDPEYSAQVPEDTRATLQQAVESARQAKEAKITKNEWLEVAQTLGRAIAQFGAAQKGMSSGRDMSGLNFGPTIDYGARSDRAERAFEGEERGLRLSDALSRQATQDENLARASEYKRRADALELGAKYAQGQEDDDRRFRRTESIEQARSDREDRREAQRGSNELIKENRRELKELQSEVTPGLTWANQVIQEPDVSPKQLKKLQEKYGALAGAAKVDMASTLDTFEKTAPRKEPGAIAGFFGMKGDIDKAQAYKNLLDASGLSKKLERIEQLKEENRRLAGGQVQSNIEEAPAAPKTVRVRSKQGKIGTVPAEQLQQALAEGYTLVE